MAGLGEFFVIYALPGRQSCAKRARKHQLEAAKTDGSRGVQATDEQAAAYARNSSSGNMSRPRSSASRIPRIRASYWSISVFRFR